MTTPSAQAWAEKMVLPMLTIYDRHGWFYADAAIASASQRHGERMGLPADVLETPLRSAFDELRTDRAVLGLSDEEWARDCSTRLRSEASIGPEWLAQLLGSHARLRSFRSNKTIAQLSALLREFL